MNDAKYIGMDVHTATISAAVRDSSGNLVMEATLETKSETILEFVHGLRGSLRVSFEEGTFASWLHDLLKPHVTEVLVCDPRKNALLRVGNKNDREDARKLSELLFLNKLHPVYHGETGIRTLKELARSYLTMTRDLTRVMNRLKAIYRGYGLMVFQEIVRQYKLLISFRWPQPWTELLKQTSLGFSPRDEEVAIRVRVFEYLKTTLVDKRKKSAKKLLSEQFIRALTLLVMAAPNAISIPTGDALRKAFDKRKRAGTTSKKSSKNS